MPCHEYRPQAKQVEFLASSADITVFGGAAGAGKTFAALLEATRHTANPGWRVVIFRRIMPQIRQEGGLWDTSCSLYPAMGAKPNSHVCEWAWPSGARIKMSHLQYEDTKFAWDGAQITLMIFDQLESFTEGQFWYLLSRNRSTCGVKPYIRATCNPRSGSWLRKLLDWWIGPDGYPIDERSGQLRWFVRQDNEVHWVEPDHVGPDGQRPKSLTFISANLEDNPALLALNPGYRDSLNALEAHERERLLKGNWNVQTYVKGQIFTEFDWTAHGMTAEEVLAVDARRDQLRLIEAHDFGSGPSHGAVVWAYHQADTDTLYIWDVLLGLEQPWEWYAAEIARRGYYVHCRKPHRHQFPDNQFGTVPHRRIGDPAGKQRDSQQKSWFSNYRDYASIQLSAAKNTAQSIETVKAMLRTGRLKLHPRLGRGDNNLVRAFGEYRWNIPENWETGDPMRVKVKPLKDWASHPMDAVRYIAWDVWGYRSPGAIPLQ